MKKLSDLPLCDQCLVHRYLYYVKSFPIIDDWEYSQMERKVQNDPDLPSDHLMQFAGGDIAEEYPLEIREIAEEIHNNPRSFQ